MVTYKYLPLYILSAQEYCLDTKSLSILIAQAVLSQIK